MLPETELLPTTVHEDHFPYQEEYNHYQGRFTLEDYSLIREVIANNPMGDYENLYNNYINSEVMEYPEFVCKQEISRKFRELDSGQDVTKTEAFLFTLLRDREDLSLFDEDNSEKIKLKSFETKCLSDHTLLAEIFLITDLDKFCSMTEGLGHIFNRSNC